MKVKITLVGGPEWVERQQVFEIKDEDAIDRDDAGGWVIIETSRGEVVYFPRQNIFSIFVEGDA